MVKCSAAKCSSVTYNKSPGLSFHRFPKDDDLKKIWVKNVNREQWQPNSNSVLCSKHFEPHLKDTSAFCTVLRPGAIPTLFEENEENLSSGKICDNENFTTSTCHNLSEPQPCLLPLIHKDSVASTTNEANFSVSILQEDRCTIGYNAPELQDVKNLSEPQSSMSFYSTNSTQIDKTLKVKVHQTSSIKEDKIQDKKYLKIKKNKTLQQIARRLKSKVSKLSHIIIGQKKNLS